MIRSKPFRFLVIIQARMNSTRFPGKVLYPIKEKPLLQHILDSLICCCAKEQIVVATSSLDSDNPISEFCKSRSIDCLRGSLNNVAERFLTVLDAYQPTVFLRISGDSPLFDYRTIENAFPLWRNELDLLTTVGGTQQSGMHVEFINTKAFYSAYPKFSLPGHFEHVTPYFYENESEFRILRLESALPDNKKLKFSLDTPEDLGVLERLFNNMDRPHYLYTLKEKAELLCKVVSGAVLSIPE